MDKLNHESISFLYKLRLEVTILEVQWLKSKGDMKTQIHLVIAEAVEGEGKYSIATNRKISNRKSYMVQ